jgi:hypothetical protein
VRIGPIAAACMQAWHRVFGVCIALYAVGWVLFVCLTLADRRYWKVA